MEPAKSTPGRASGFVNDLTGDGFAHSRDVGFTLGWSVVHTRRKSRSSESDFDGV